MDRSSGGSPGPAAFLFVEGTRVLRTKTSFEARLLQIADPAARDLGFEVVRVRVMAGRDRKTLQIMAEREDGSMSADDCAALSRALSAIFDVDDPFAGEWTLEISSPGIDRPLTMPQHFTRWEGFEARIELDRMVEGRKRFKGELAGVEGENILINLPGEDDVTAEIPFSWIAEAKLVLTDELIEESLRRRGPVDDPEDGDDAPAEQEQDEQETEQ